MAPINTQMAKHAMYYFYILLCLSKQNQNQTKNKAEKTKEVWHTSIAFEVSKFSHLEPLRHARNGDRAVGINRKLSSPSFVTSGT